MNETEPAATVTSLPASTPLAEEARLRGDICVTVDRACRLPWEECGGCRGYGVLPLPGQPRRGESNGCTGCGGFGEVEVVALHGGVCEEGFFWAAHQEESVVGAQAVSTSLQGHGDCPRGLPHPVLRDEGGR